MRKSLFTWNLIALLALAVVAIGCNAKQAKQIAREVAKAARETKAPTASIPSATAPAAAQPGDTIKIASFNIQVFGTSKLKKPQAMDVLTRVVRRFDVVAIQEVRSTDDSVVPKFVELINADGSKYDFVIGPRLGRTNSKEQYAVLFNTARIEVDRAFVYTVDDPKDLLHREPMVARFRVRGVPPEQVFTFNLVDIHTDPDETASELDALADVFVGVQHNGSGEDDVILLGDLNVDEYHLGKLGRLPGIAHAITGVMTNTRRDKMYDNIVFDSRATAEYTGRWGVVDLTAEFGLTQQQALEVSDHCPVWAEFSAYEKGTGSVATRPGTATR
jgi:deoxyribonuclease-1-like protein